MIPEEEIAVLVDSFLVGIVSPDIINGLVNGLCDIVHRMRRDAQSVRGIVAATLSHIEAVAA